MAPPRNPRRRSGRRAPSQIGHPGTPGANAPLVKAKLPVVASLVLSSLLVATAASADDTAPPPASSDEWTANAARNKVYLNYDVWPTSQAYVMAWDIGGQYRVAEDISAKGDGISVEARYSFNYFSASAGGFTVDQFAYGNPTIGARYTRPLDDLVKDLRAYGGLTWTAPVLSEPDQFVGVAALLGMSDRAFFDIERHLPYFMTFRLNVGAEYRITPNLFYRGDLNPVILVPTRDGLDSELIVEQSNEIEYRADMGLGGGLRFQEAFMTLGSDAAQLATELFVAYTPKGPGIYGRAGLLVALDETAGFGFDKDKLATLKFTVGYNLE